MGLVGESNENRIWRIHGGLGMYLTGYQTSVVYTATGVTEKRKELKEKVKKKKSDNPRKLCHHCYSRFLSLSATVVVTVEGRRSKML